jgi:cell division protein FtsI (penicillin-binding protein 3)
VDTDVRFKRRFKIAIFGLAGLGILLLGRYAYLMLAPGEPLRQAPGSVERGAIIDRNGKLLAAPSPQYNVAVWKPDLRKDFIDAELPDLSDLLGLDATDASAKLNDSSSDYLYLKKKVDDESVRKLREAKSKGLYKGVVIEENPGRTYPLGELACHVLGYMGDDGHGLGGVEFNFDKQLSPQAKPGHQSFGNQVALTLDISVQTTMERVARETFEKNSPESLMFLAMDPRNGAILGYVALPSFDPGDLRSASSEQLRNLPVNYSYEPGSVFKVFTLSGIMQLGGINESSQFFCDGAYHNDSGREKIKIRCMGVHGWVNIRSILSQSCNSGAGYASDTVSNDNFFNIIKAYGFGQKTGIELSGEELGYVRPVAEWSLRSKPTMAMGQEVLVTAVQVLQAAGAVANGGVLMKPRLVSRIVSPEGKLVWDNPPVAERRVLTEANSRKIIDYMESAVANGGTGHRAKVDDVRMAVKTGTAQMVDPGSSAYSPTDFIASCLAILPAESPELVLYMAVVKPRGDSIQGSRVVAPALAETADELVGLLNIRRGATEVASHGQAINVPAQGPAEIGETMPDLSGYSKARLLPLLSRTDINVIIRGAGFVHKQTPEAGAPISQGANIVLELR